MDYNQFFKDLKANKIAPVYLFWGEENYLLEEAIKTLIEKLVDPATADFNLDVFYASEVDGAKILQTATSFPIMAEYRVVVVKELDRLKTQGLQLMSSYAKKPSNTTCLILTASELNFRLKPFQELKKSAQEVEFKQLYDNQVLNWIKQYVNEKKYTITEEAITLIHENVGNSLRELVNEFDKIFLNSGERKQIEGNDVRHVVGLSRDFSIFELLNFIGERQIRAALTTLARILELGESPIKIITMLTRHFGILLKVRHGQRTGLPQNQVASIAGVAPFFLNDYQRQARNFTPEQVQKAFHSLMKADIALKSSSQKPFVILELLIYNLIKN